MDSSLSHHGLVAQLREVSMHVYDTPLTKHGDELEAKKPFRIWVPRGRAEPVAQPATTPMEGRFCFGERRKEE